MSMPQRVVLKAIYGCELDGREQDERGWTELDYWAASQGSATWDDLGYITAVTRIPYVQQEYREAWGIKGIRSGKTDRFAATVVAYEAVCGGHEAFVREGRPAICFQIAQDIKMAKYSLSSIHQTLKGMAFLKYGSTQSWVTNVTADRIELKNNVVIAVTPPTVKSVRGYDSPVAVLDEVGVWYQDADSANPDFEVYDQIASRQAQFAYPKIIGISSPWNRAGLLWKRSQAGTNGSRLRCVECRFNHRFRPDCPTCDVERKGSRSLLVSYGTTASFNPIVAKSWLTDKRDKDPRAFERECLARFQDSLSGFLSSALIEKARAVGVTHRPPEARNFYIAAMDPAFRRDAFGFTIVHADPKLGIVQDRVERWQSSGGVPLDPGPVLAEIYELLKLYRIKTVFSDQYSIETLQLLANQIGFSIEEVTFSSGSKAEIYANLQQLLNQNRLSLLDHEETIAELKSVEKKNTQGGAVQIAAPEGQHDDMATVIAIAAHQAVWLLPTPAKVEAKPIGMIEKHIQHIAQTKARTIRLREGSDDW